MVCFKGHKPQGTVVSIVNYGETRWCHHHPKLCTVYRYIKKIGLQHILYIFPNMDPKPTIS